MKRTSFLFVCNAFLALWFITPASATNPVGESGPQETIDDYSRFYLNAGGQVDLALSTVNNTNTLTVALGAGYHLSRSFSCELGIAYNTVRLESDVEVKGGLKGLMSALVYHKDIPGNLKYVPQLEVDYLTGTIGKTKLGFAGVTLVPLAFEYREDDSSLGITAGIGEFGAYFPFSGIADKSGPVYVFGFNNVSLGLVFYF